MRIRASTVLAFLVIGLCAAVLEAQTVDDGLLMRRGALGTGSAWFAAGLARQCASAAGAFLAAVREMR